MAEPGTNINLEKLGNGIKSLLIIGGVVWFAAKFFFTAEFGQKAFVEEQQTRHDADEALYSRITKTTGRNADWNLKQDNTMDKLRDEIMELKVKEARYEEHEKLIEWRIKALEKTGSDD